MTDREKERDAALEEERLRELDKDLERERLAQPVQHCHDCGRFTNAGPCDGCGKVFCQPCAEKPYVFCCMPEPQ